MQSFGSLQLPSISFFFFHMKRHIFLRPIKEKTNHSRRNVFNRFLVFVNLKWVFTINYTCCDMWSETACTVVAFQTKKIKKQFYTKHKHFKTLVFCVKGHFQKHVKPTFNSSLIPPQVIPRMIDSDVHLYALHHVPKKTSKTGAYYTLHLIP